MTILILLLHMTLNQERLFHSMTGWQTQQQHHMWRISKMHSKHIKPSKIGKKKFVVLEILPQKQKDEAWLNSNQKLMEKPIPLHWKMSYIFQTCKTALYLLDNRIRGADSGNVKTELYPLSQRMNKLLQKAITFRIWIYTKCVSKFAHQRSINLIKLMR